MKRIIIYISILIFLGGMVFYKISNTLFSAESLIKLPYKSACFEADDVKRDYYISQLAMMQDPDVIKHAIKMFRLDELYEVDAIELEEDLIDHVKVFLVSDKDLISVKTDALTEEQSQQINYAIVYTCEKRMMEQKRIMRNDASVKLAKRLRVEQAKLKQYRKEIKVQEATAKKLNIPQLEAAEKSARLEKMKTHYENTLGIVEVIKSVLETEEWRIGSRNFSIVEKPWSPFVKAIMEARKVRE